ncbi:MAG: dihydrodipicolinate synthase family protein [Sulfitobacter sp.]
MRLKKRSCNELDHLKKKLEGCYVTIPTPFHDTAEMEVNETALRAYVRFLIDSGLNENYATLLAGGAAGDFSTMSFEERIRVAEIVVDEAAGAVPIAMGAQTASTLELVRLARAAKRIGVNFIQVSCPFYFAHTEGDFEEYVRAAAAAEPDLGIIVYNTFWTSQNLSFAMIERLAEIPNIVGLKWAAPRTDAMEFEDVCAHFSDRFTIIDNNLFFGMSAMPALGAKAFEVHHCNFWPEWGIKLIDEVQAGNYAELTRMLVEEGMPFYKLWVAIERDFTSGDGYLDKLCMELIGLQSSRCRPPTRDIRDSYRTQTQEMMESIGVPRLSGNA